jgi:hypothetical protein
MNLLTELVYNILVSLKQYTGTVAYDLRMSFSVGISGSMPLPRK